MRLLSSLTLGAVVAAWVVTTAATAPQPELVQGTPHAAAVTERLACWNEPKRLGLPTERICGSANAAPADAFNFGAYADGECNYVGEDCYSALTGLNLSRMEAARAIAERIDSGQALFEDWTWEGMPAVVGQHNDALLNAWESDGRPDAFVWLMAESGDHYAVEVLGQMQANAWA